jgi:hypothetical protein
MSVAQARTKAEPTWTAQQLRSMPAAKRDVILAAAAKRAVADYRTGSALTDFDAFGKEESVYAQIGDGIRGSDGCTSQRRGTLRRWGLI